MLHNSCEQGNVGKFDIIWKEEWACKKAEIPTFKNTKSSDGLDYANPENLGNLIYPQFSPP